MIQHRTVLIVEDSETDRYIFKRYLSADDEISYTILESNSAAEGLEVCQTQSLDGILLDIKLPGVSGFEFLSQLKAHLPGGCPPVVVVSSYNDAVTAATAFKNGVEDYFVKGQTSPDAVRAAMRSAIENTELRRKLQQVEAERDQLLCQAQAARAEAETANSSKDEFLAIVAHELRSPLNSIFGWAKLLQAKAPDPKTLTRALQSIERSAKTQLQLIEDLLDVSRMVQGNLRIDRAPIRLSLVIEAAIDMIRPLAEAKQIQIESNLDQSAHEVLGDSSRLQQVVWNLLTNAIKFTPEQGRIEISLTHRESQSEIRVSDTGKGINAAFLPFVFDRFRQAQTNAPKSHDGLGLGLAIARELVELHEGTITAASLGEERGATFTVTLPLINGSPPEPQGLNGLKILVVDDDLDSLDLVKFILEEQGAIICTANSANMAIEKFQDFCPALLISDIAMPEKDGYELIQEIRATGQTIPAIALTAYVSDDVKQQTFATGYRIHLSKPLDVERLLEAIAALIRQ